MFCSNCGNKISKDTVFCSNCGKKISYQKNNKSKLIFCVLVCGFVIMVGLVCLHIKSQKSPISNVSSRVYNEAMQYIDKMYDTSIKGEIEVLIEKNPHIKTMDISTSIKGRNFNLYIGDKPTEEEKLLKKLVGKIWQYKCVIYAYEVLVDQYGQYNNSDVDEAMYMAKGVIAETDQKIDDAVYMLKNAKTMKDLKMVDKMLDGIFTEE